MLASVAMVTGCCCVRLQETSSDEEDEGGVVEKGGVVDMEDMGKILMKQSKRSETNNKEMVTPLLRKNLTKQGTSTVCVCVSC